MLPNCNKNCAWCKDAMLCPEKFNIIHNIKEEKDDNKKEE